MDSQSAETLRKLNNAFYRSQAVSFSASRNAPWEGWKRVIGHFPTDDELSVLDVACGNMRFEKYLLEMRNATTLSACCIDSCADLAVSLPGCRFVQADVLEAKSIATGEGDAHFDAVVSFGFMHHVPGAAARQRVLRQLVQAARPGGVVAVSLWRFAEDEKLRLKAQATTAQALRTLDVQLDEEDYLLGWNDVPGAFRYCHSFSDDETDKLVSSIAEHATLIDRFAADGRTGAMNGYLVFRK